MARARPRGCHLTSAHAWYGERIFQKQARSLAAAGYEVSVVGPMEHDREEGGVRLIALPRARGRAERLLLSGPRVLARALAVGADIYHFHDPELIPVGLALRALGKHVIYDAHEDYRTKVLSKEWIPAPLRRPIALATGLVERGAARWFDYVIGADSGITGRFEGLPAATVRNLPPRAFGEGAGPAAARAAGGPLRVVYLGQITSSRGVGAALDALPRLGVDWELHLVGLVGDPALEARLAADPRVVLHGRVPWGEVPALLAGMDVGLLLLLPTPSYRQIVGDGITKLFEYMGAGLPVLYSDFPGLSRLIGGLGAGVAVDPTDAAAIARALTALAADPAGRAAMGARGREAVRERYHWERDEQTLLSVYEAVSGRIAR